MARRKSKTIAAHPGEIRRTEFMEPMGITAYRPSFTQAVESYGGQGRNRTADASLFRAALYQLSYLATLAMCRIALQAGHRADRFSLAEIGL